MDDFSSDKIMIDDIQALHQTVDILCRSEKHNSIKNLMKDLEDILPKNSVGYDLRAYAYYKAKDYKLAMKYGEFALGSSSGTESTAVRYNLGKIYLNANEPIKAKNCFQIIARMSNKIDVKLDLAAALYACNQKDEAMHLLLELDENGWQLETKDELAVQFNLGAHMIRHGDFKKGMEYLSIGRKLRIWGSFTHNFPIPEWDGATQEGKHILIIGEGGIGDEIINARFVRHINERGMKASFASCQGLDTILSRMPFEKVQNYQKFTTDIQDIREYDYWTPAMNLPKTLGIDASELWNGPYIGSNMDYYNKWKELFEITEDDKPAEVRVGIRWSGNPLYEQDLHRTIPLDDVLKVIPKNWTKYSIQKDEPFALDHLDDEGEHLVYDLDPILETFEDALGCMDNLDVIITSCTSLAHAAGAMGKPVIVMVPIMDYYVWAEGGVTSSWYGDNVILVRQTTPKSWDSAIEELGEHLKFFNVIFGAGK